MAPNNPTLNQDDDQCSGCTEQMDVFRRCSISFAIKVSVECISPSLPEQWRPDASSLGETHTQTGGRHQRGQRFVKTTTKTTKMNCAPSLGETLVMTWHECGSGNLTLVPRGRPAPRLGTASKSPKFQKYLFCKISCTSQVHFYISPRKEDNSKDNLRWP